MNEEEKEAIEELSKKAVLCNYEERDYPNMICFKKDVLIALNLIEKLQKENEELKNIELKSKGGAIKISLDGILFLENKIKQLEKEKKELELEIKNREFSHMNLYNEYKYYKQNSLSNEKIEDKIKYLNDQRIDWIEDRELKVSDSEIMFAINTLKELIGV